jgi:hypothetical protein
MDVGYAFIGWHLQAQLVGAATKTEYPNKGDKTPLLPPNYLHELHGEFHKTNPFPNSGFHPSTI